MVWWSNSDKKIILMPLTIQNTVSAFYPGNKRYLKRCKRPTLSKQLTALAIHLGIQWGCQSKVTDGSGTGQGAISARCRTPSNTSTIQVDSCDIASELCHLTTIHKRAWEQANVLTLFCRAGAKERGSRRGLSQKELGQRPTFCQFTFTTVAPRYK